jgi:hypothetical protein
MNRQRKAGALALRTLLLVLAWPLADAALAHGDEVHTHGDEAAAGMASSFAALPVGESPRRLADGSLYVPKSAQRAWGVRTRVVTRENLAAVVELNGTVIPDPDTAGRIQATQAGSVLPGPKGMPVPGRAVRKGEVLVYLRFAADAVQRGNQQAQLAEIDAQLQLAEKRVQRLEALAAGAGAVAQDTLDAARSEVVALATRRAFIHASVNHSDALIAPVSGIVSASHVVAGEVVDARDTLFEIVDPSRLWVEALAYDAALVANLRAAVARAGDVALDLAFVGGGRQLRAQALPLLFRITTTQAPVAVGQPLQVIVQTAQRLPGMKLARSALTGLGAGEDTVWVHSAAERFTPRRVRVQSLDARHVVVLAGLVDGDRVVEQGASLLAQVR